MPFLLIWPTARSTALAGAMTALADDPDAGFWNPAGLVQQERPGASITYVNWLPGLNPGMHYAHASGGAPLRVALPGNRQLSLGGSATYIQLGEVDLINERGEFLGRYPVWRGAAGLHVGARIIERLDVGIGIRLAHSQYGYEDEFWPWPFMADPATAFDSHGTGTTFGADLGIRWTPTSFLSAGAVVANVGPDLKDISEGESEPMPAMLRIGLAWTPVNSQWVRLTVAPELSKVLVGAFGDSASTLASELKTAFKSLGVELTALDIMSLRLGYFEDLEWGRGGVTYEDDGVIWRRSLWDAITRRLESGAQQTVHFCWGFGIGYKDIARFDFGTDAAIYDFKTSNSKFTLTVNNIPALGRLFSAR